MILSNKHIALTNYGSIESFQILKDFGATLHHFPMIDIVGNSNVKPFNLSDFDYYIFTSKNGVNAFFNLDFVKEKKINTFLIFNYIVIILTTCKSRASQKEKNNKMS